MATRSFIGVVVNPQDKGKFIEPNIVLLGKGISSDFDEPEFHRTTIENTTEVIRIYHHWDGYPEGVGEDLLRDFNSYDKALKLILEGDHSTPYESYTSKGEDWVSNRPDQRTEPICYEEYLYVFKDGEWKMPTEDDDYEDLVDEDGYISLKDYLN